MPDTKRPADYRDIARRRNALWLGPVARNANTRTWWKCLVCGRWWRTVYNALQRGSGCPDCAVRRRNGLNTRGPGAYRALAESRGFRWTGRYPGSANARTEWTCPRGHAWRSTYTRIAEGRGCPGCARLEHLERCARDRHTDADYRAAAARAGLEWLGSLPGSAWGKTRWRCLACERFWVAPFHKLAQGRGCPRCRLDRRNAGQRIPPGRYHALAVERGFEWLGPPARRNIHPTRWRCRKGHEWEASYACIERGAGCHGCQDRVNGMPVSQNQRRLARMLGGELNRRVGRLAIDVALERDDVRIAVEYDGWYFHGGQQDRDEARDRDLVALGWRVLRIRSAYMLPSQGELDGAIRLLAGGEQRVVLTLRDWGVGRARGLAWEPARPPRPYHRRHGAAHA